MKLLEKLGGEFKALGAELKSRPFSAYCGATYGVGYGALPGYGLPFSGGLPGSQYDDHTAAGVLWENPAAAACFVALTKAFAQARPYLEKRVRPDSNEWKRLDHPIIELLERPNAYYSGEKMFGVTLVCAMSQGAAFWRFERDRKGDVSEIWYEPPVGLGATGIAPNWDRQHFIKDFYYFIDGQRSPEPIPREDVIYFRHGLNVANPRLPWSPLGLGAREIAVLNSASSYTSAVMRNHGMPAGFVSMDGGGLSSSTPPTPEQAESLKAQIENKFGGPHNAGKTFVSSLPWKWNKVGMTPAEMVIDKIRQWPQETVCALLGTPVIVALLPTGEQPTYQNLDASMRWWWDNTIIPLEDAFADEIETQMFPAFGLDAANYRLAWDRSKIPALQEDESAKHAMWREDYRAGGIDRYTYLTKIGEQADEKLKGVLHPSATPKDSDESDTLSAAKAFWDEALKHNYDPFQARDENGRWTTMPAWVSLEPHQEKAYNHLTKDYPDREKYFNFHQSMRDALANMPEVATSRIIKNVNRVVIDHNETVLNMRMARDYGDHRYDTRSAYDYRARKLLLVNYLMRNGYKPPPEAAATWPEKPGRWANEAGRLERRYIYAHELCHAIDGPHSTLSGKNGWKSNWKAEIEKKGLLKGNKNPDFDESEGFADFGYLFYYSSNRKQLMDKYPQSYKYWDPESPEFWGKEKDSNVT